MLSVGHIWLLAILLIIVLIIWGPGKLPDVGSGLGRAIQEFRKASTDARSEVSKAVSPQAPTASAPAETPAPVAPSESPAPAPGPAPAAPAESTASTAASAAEAERSSLP
ncbi:MAG: Sec-independent protein translocase subunit TatA/TatB [Candidatus Dormibacteria bacterium]